MNLLGSICGVNQRAGARRRELCFLGERDLMAGTSPR
jgi:hypothetical protein